jgi:hypothetical protein
LFWNLKVRRASKGKRAKERPQAAQKSLKQPFPEWQKFDFPVYNTRRGKTPLFKAGMGAAITFAHLSPQKSLKGVDSNINRECSANGTIGETQATLCG